ncbi:glycosyltransferase [Chloroflexus sp.]|uniref:glycosyltransferase n=1 Tax=Chloroflexus sp. TaxID=1904827 RepID=UPI003C70666B
MIVYIAYPTSLNLQSANALQTFTTLRELRARRPDTLALIPRWGNEPSRFFEVGAVHLPRPAIGKLSRLYKSTLLYYLEHSAFAAMTATVVALRRHNVQAVYIRQPIIAAWWAGVFGPRFDLPVIYEAHDLESRNPSRAKEPWARGFLDLIDRTALCRSSAVVSLTDNFRRLLAQIEWRDPAEVAVIPDAYDEQVFRPQDRAACRRGLGLPADAPIVAYAGMTFAHRWLDGLLSAIRRLRAIHPTLIGIVIGGRPGERAALAAHALSEGLRVAETTAMSADLYLLPLRPQIEVVSCLGAANVLVIPDTVTDVTASPLKLFEYMALGLPIVLPAIPALYEILPSHLAYSFTRRDLNGLQAALTAALAECDPALATERQRLAAEHTYGRRAERIIALVEQVAQRKL